MSDLIRREDVIKLVNQFVFGLCKEQNDEVRRTFNKYIEKMPTAYNIDKVVAELESNSFITVKNEEVKTKRKDIQSYISVEKEVVLLKDAIEIVKQGGVSDDVCDWEYDGDNLITSCGDYFNLYDNCTEKFKYCPVCGKKINVVEQV